MTVSRDTAITFLNGIIKPACEAIGLWSDATGQLLLGTALQESGLVYRRQLNNGPALGLFQMEPLTHDDCWDNYLAYRPKLAAKVLQVAARIERPEPSWLVAHDCYAAAMARIKYLRISEPLPPYGDIPGQAEYWLKWYNAGGRGSVDAYLRSWESTMGTDNG